MSRCGTVPASPPMPNPPDPGVLCAACTWEEAGTAPRFAGCQFCSKATPNHPQLLPGRNDVAKYFPHSPPRDPPPLPSLAQATPVSKHRWASVLSSFALCILAVRFCNGSSCVPLCGCPVLWFWGACHSNFVSSWSSVITVYEVSVALSTGRWFRQFLVISGCVDEGGGGVRRPSRLCHTRAQDCQGTPAFVQSTPFVRRKAPPSPICRLIKGGSPGSGAVGYHQQTRIQGWGFPSPVLGQDGVGGWSVGGRVGVSPRPLMAAWRWSPQGLHGMGHRADLYTGHLLRTRRVCTRVPSAYSSTPDASDATQLVGRVFALFCSCHVSSHARPPALLFQTPVLQVRALRGGGGGGVV